MQVTQITMYIYSTQMPASEMKLYRCIICTRPLFKANSGQIVISNAYGAPFQSLPPHSSYIEHQCHSCKALYAILFQ